MQSRPISHPWSANADLSRQLPEDAAKVSFLQLRSMACHQECRQKAPSEDLIAHIGVFAQHQKRRRMHGHKACFAELRSADRENSLQPVHILRLKIDSLPESETADG